MSKQNTVEQKLIAAVQQSMQSHPNAQRCWLAVSGGLDSMVLLHIAAPLFQPRVLHINHQLSSQAAHWQAHVEAAAKALNLPCFSHRVTVATGGQGLEQAARQARYSVFEASLATDDCLLLAHHQDDQAETLLLRLLRGTGLAGLGAMATSRPLGQGHLLRPFLGIRRTDLQAYAESKQIQWVEDESNSEPRFDRNYLRHHVLPSLAQRWPTSAERFAQVAKLARQDYQLLSDYLQADLDKLAPRIERWGYSIALPPLLNKPPHHRHSLIRLWLSQLQFAVPLQAHLQQLEQLLYARPDATACVSFGNCQIRRFQHRLYAMSPLPSLSPDWQALWCSDELVSLPAGCFLPKRPEDIGLAAGHYRLQMRRGGERCRPATRPHSQSLKKLLQEAQLEPWLRDRIPLVYDDDQMVAVGDLWLNQQDSA